MRKAQSLCFLNNVIIDSRYLNMFIWNIIALKTRFETLAIISYVYPTRNGKRALKAILELVNSFISASLYFDTVHVVSKISLELTGISSISV